MSEKSMDDYMGGLDFVVPSECGGQIVEVSYALGEDGYTYRYWHDRSDGERKLSRSRTLEADEGDYWNGAPINRRWKEIARTVD